MADETISATRRFWLFSGALTLAMLAAWNAEHGYFYWAADCAVLAADALLLQYHNGGQAS